MDASLAEPHPFSLTSVESYEPLVGAKTVERVLKKADKLHDLHIINVNSTYYGGGVAEILASLTLLMNAAGVKTGWRVIQGRPDFFSITKKMHNALQGGEINLSELKRDIYEEVVFENAVRMHLDHDLVIIHDPQPLPLIRYFRKKAPWVWRCHVDLSNPNQELWSYLAPFIERYDAVVLSLPEYAQKVTPPQRFIMPAINPFSTTNKELSEEEIEDRLHHYGIPTDLPLVVQISRFDKWKDPQGVIDAFRIARRQVDATLALVGNVATDDPEGQEIFESLMQVRRGPHPYSLSTRLRTRQRIAAPRRSCTAEVDPGGLRSHGDRGDVERHARHRRQSRRNSTSDRRWRERLPRRERGTSR